MTNNAIKVLIGYGGRTRLIQMPKAKEVDKAYTLISMSLDKISNKPDLKNFAGDK
jgi:hypothetical protein